MTRIKSQWDRMTAVATAIGGGVVLYVGWWGVSGTAYPAEQLPFIVSAGLTGLFLLGISTALWLSADLHDEWRKLDRIERAIRAAQTEVSTRQGDTETRLYSNAGQGTAGATSTAQRPAAASGGVP